MIEQDLCDQYLLPQIHRSSIIHNKLPVSRGGVLSLEGLTYTRAHQERDKALFPHKGISSADRVNVQLQLQSQHQGWKGLFHWLNPDPTSESSHSFNSIHSPYSLPSAFYSKPKYNWWKIGNDTLCFFLDPFFFCLKLCFEPLSNDVGLYLVLC